MFIVYLPLHEDILGQVTAHDVGVMSPFCYGGVGKIMVQHLAPLHDVQTEIPLHHRTTGVLVVYHVTNRPSTWQVFPCYTGLSGNADV